MVTSTGYGRWDFFQYWLLVPNGLPIFLRPRGYTHLVGYYNFSSEWGADLSLERDILVLWLGNKGTDRRRKYLQQVRAELKKRGIEIVVIDGIEIPYVFGEERTILLNLTQITVNI